MAYSPGSPIKVLKIRPNALGLDSGNKELDSHFMVWHVYLLGLPHLSVTLSSCHVFLPSASYELSAIRYLPNTMPSLLNRARIPDMDTLFH